MEILEPIKSFGETLWNGFCEIGNEHKLEVQRKLIPQVSNYLVQAEFGKGMEEFIRNISALKYAGISNGEIQKGITRQISEDLGITDEEALALILKNTGLDKFESFGQFKAAYDEH